MYYSIMTMLFLSVAIGTSEPLSRSEQGMLEALQTRNASAVRSIIGRRLELFTVINGRKANISSSLSDSYLIANDQIRPGNDDSVLKTSLERLSRIIAVSKAYGKTNRSFAPHKLKSIHNDLTDSTIRGYIKSDDYWELHYTIRENGTVTLRRVCEFDHASRFVW